MQKQQKFHASIFHETWKTSFWALFAQKNQDKIFLKKPSSVMSYMTPQLHDKNETVSMTDYGEKLWTKVQKDKLASRKTDGGYSRWSHFVGPKINKAYIKNLYNFRENLTFKANRKKFREKSKKFLTEKNSHQIPTLHSLIKPWKFPSFSHRKEHDYNTPLNGVYKLLGMCI